MEMMIEGTKDDKPIRLKWVDGLFVAGDAEVVAAVKARAMALEGYPLRFALEPPITRNFLRAPLPTLAVLERSGVRLDKVTGDVPRIQPDVVISED